MWRIRADSLTDSVYNDAIGSVMADYFDHNWGSTQSRATEWKAMKVVLRVVGSAISTSIQHTLSAELKQRINWAH